MKVFIATLLFLPFWLQAQQPNKIICTHINNRNGLMPGSINSIVQDKNGFVWIAGDEGLQRYDGYEFSNYYHNPNKPNETFPNGRLNSLAIDTKNRLWIGSFANGFGWYNSNFNFNKSYSTSNQKLLSTSAFGYRDFLFANDSVTYACSTDGVVKLINDNIVKIFNPANSPLQGSLVGKIVKDKNANIWIGTVSGLNFLSANEKHLYNHTNNSTIKAFANNVMRDNVGNKSAIAEMFVDSKNNLWITTWKPELYRYNIDENILETISLPEKKQYDYDNMCLSFVEDNEGNIWIGTSNNGLYKYSYNNSFLHFTHLNDDEQSIGTNAISKVMKDNDGNIWLAGESSISIFNPSYHLIKNILPQSNQITATMVAKDKTLWAADIEWLYHFNEKLLLLNKFRHQSNINQKRLEGGVWKIKESLNEKEIFIQKQEGFAIFNKQTNSIDAFDDVSIVKNNPISDIIELPDGNIYLLRWWWEKNLLFLDRKKRTAVLVSVPMNDKENFEISCGIKKDQSHYYLFSKRGLMLLNTEKKQVEIIDSNYIAGSSILVNNQFYSATAIDGIRMYDIATKKITTISKYEGFPVNNTKSIVYTGNDNFWIASSSGLIRWNKAKNIFTTINKNEGILNSSLHGSSLAVMPDGKIIFSNGSLMALDTSFIKKQLPPKVNIISCIVGDSLLTPSQLSNNITISYANNVVQLKFAAINYPKLPIKYEYLLEEYDDVWKDGSSRFVNYTNLPSGNYVFKVKAAGDDGVWSSEITKLNFHVTQVFYKAWWFYVLLAATLFSTILFYYRIRIYRLVELQKLRNNISRDLHDEVGSTLSSISILSTSVINNMEREPVKTKEWVNQIGKYAQHMLNVMDDIVWAINPKMDGFASIVSRMKEVAYSTAEASDIKVFFYYDEQLDNVLLPMLTKRNLYLIFKETINNAAKHAACKNIHIELKKINDTLIFLIKDDGKGFDTAKEVSRNGIKNVKQRAIEIKAHISIKSSINNGTITELIIYL
jgi:ligand-binding sensor domain-containing protein/two-component sensor histidine kinase